ncbi:hypothetical protein N7462_007718 [Penicillium macrosclerotiorum]|uniref:uncharacterized protein n=1 Tax=Penicillium macrosclerotiorum TaxID=303699 RepID=UPI0025491ABE|nr:uncharacterized protein N7462_007718 [Penicillium macrosclerotiorum]KAJ5679474.1 hypothetical protein N7462_007718 [Penicillium macrosclerotiorum]
MADQTELWFEADDVDVKPYEENLGSEYLPFVPWAISVLWQISECLEDKDTRSSRTMPRTLIKWSNRITQFAELNQNSLHGDFLRVATLLCEISERLLRAKGFVQDVVLGLYNVHTALRSLLRKVINTFYRVTYSSKGFKMIVTSLSTSFRSCVGEVSEKSKAYIDVSSHVTVIGFLVVMKFFETLFRLGNIKRLPREISLFLETTLLIVYFLMAFTRDLIHGY